jgi:hypothetical protein
MSKETKKNFGIPYTKLKRRDKIVVRYGARHSFSVANKGN